MRSLIIQCRRVGVGIVGLMLLPISSHSLEIDVPHDSVSAYLKTNVSLGAMWRVESRSAELAATDDVVQMTQAGYGTQINRNDGNNNFDRGLSSVVAKITPELDLSFGSQYGLKLSGSVFRDFMIMDHRHDGGALELGSSSYNGIPRSATFSHYANNGANDRFTRATEKRAGQRARLLDAYVWGDFDVFDRALTVKAGRHVINWGEALFMQNGVNSANYIEAATLRQPGSELREALLPLASISASYDLTDQLTTEAFYQFEWQNTEDVPVGSYYSTHDAFPAEGGANVIVDGRVLATASSNPGLASAFTGYTNTVYGTDYGFEPSQVTVKRVGDKKARDQGQFGVAFRYFSDALAGTEFGFYYTRTHAKLPVVGARLDTINVAAMDAVGAAEMIDDAKYQMAYLNDIDMFGASFNAGVGALALSGEIAFRPKQPIINEVGDNLIAGLAQTSMESSMAGQTPTVGSVTNHCARNKIGGSCLPEDHEISQGETLYFYDTARTYNVSLLGIYDLGALLAADNVMWLTEVGAERIDGLARSRNGETLHYSSTAAIAESEAEVRHPENQHKTYLDRFSWGYKTMLRADYSNLLPTVTVSPSLLFSHDVNGNSPMGGNFMQHRKAATLGVDFTFLNNLTVAAQYTSFWGAGYSNKLRDRDNASLSLKYSF